MPTLCALSLSTQPPSTHSYVTVNDRRVAGPSWGRGPLCPSPVPTLPQIPKSQFSSSDTQVVPTQRGIPVMGSIKASKVCAECGEEYHRYVSNPDEKQDLYEGRASGTCDDCWRVAMVEMWGGKQ